MRTILLYRAFTAPWSRTSRQADVEPREVEERQQVAVADIEEEMVGTLVVAVLKDLRERELEQVLVEADGAFHVSAEDCDMVYAASGGR